jgi:hypothetical protein
MSTAPIQLQLHVEGSTLLRLHSATICPAGRSL